jgi:hypothetical protein
LFDLTTIVASNAMNPIPNKINSIFLYLCLTVMRRSGGAVIRADRLPPSGWQFVFSIRLWPALP